MRLPGHPLFQAATLLGGGPDYPRLNPEPG